MSKLTQEVPRLGLYSGLSDSTTHVLASVPQASGYLKNYYYYYYYYFKRRSKFQESRSLHCLTSRTQNHAEVPKEMMASLTAVCPVALHLLST